MSTKLEDLSVSDEGEEYMADYEDYDEKEDFYEEKDGLNEEKIEPVEIYSYIFTKVKEPLLVGILVFLFTNKLFLQLVNTIPMVDIVNNTVGLNLILAILASIIFFIVREFV